MSVANPHVVEVSESQFEVEVLERSHETPILVDFWAPWCGPCRMLGPVLEEIATEMNGAFVLAKVNTEAEPGLGSRYGIRSIPAVKLFVRGKVVGEFMGALPGTQVRRFLETHLPSEADALLQQAEQARAAGDLVQARDRAREAVEIEPKHAAAHLLLAELAFESGDAPLVQHHADAIDPMADEADRANRWVDAMRFWQACPDDDTEARAKKRLEDDEADAEARYVVACGHARRREWKAALEHFLEVVKRDHKEQGKAAKEAMVVIFGFLSRDDPMRDEYFGQLQIYT